MLHYSPLLLQEQLTAECTKSLLVPLLVLCPFFFSSWTLSASPAKHHFSFLDLVHWKDYSGSGTRRGCKKSTSTGMFLKWECVCRQGFDGFMDRNESRPSPRQFSQHATMSPLYFDPSSLPVPWLLGLLCYVTSLPCHCPHSLTAFYPFLCLKCLLILGIYTPNSASDIFD